MEKAKKSLKELSILIIALAGLSLVRIVVDVIIHGFNSTPVIEGVSEQLAHVLGIVAWACGLLFLLPEVFVGYKGLKMVKNPDGTKSHIVIAKIIFVCLIISLVSLILELTKGVNLVVNIITVVDVLLDAIVYYLYIRYANIIRKQNQN